MTQTSRKAHQDPPDELKAKPQQESPGPDSEPRAACFDPETASAEQWAALVESKDTEICQIKDRVLRLGAEMENTRKRLERERSECVQFANEAIIRELLPIVDNLERALEHAAKDSNVQSLTEGVSNTLKAFLDSLARFGCAPFEAIGKPFDPNFHEAVLQEDSSDVPENTVLQELQKGYTLHSRLLRPSIVVISRRGTKTKQASAKGKVPHPEPKHAT
jgi:molecular chaperone GrpE